ncbi:inosine-uridine nucleoside N-ribohydrolase [Salana multivorans]|uniref:Inosine-uridine nucleoside N-ribohydrolase n=1 Tax=Salana multivorans TaxID=120377 RepID=A0A3N2DBE5_9MICO|nr:nucleoside hydrolase [Salana multivorans]ROR97130.1 inosine-uridine nucleoside N-ribohydrolase [Salana multivorans]
MSPSVESRTGARRPDPPAPPVGSRTWTIGQTPWREHEEHPGGRTSVVLDNDYSGDPDGLYQLAHHLLSPSVRIAAVVGSRLPRTGRHASSPDTARDGELAALDLFARMGLASTELIHRGSPDPLPAPGSPAPSAATAAIIGSAMLASPEQPLLYLAGGGLTDLATALLVEPRIAERILLVWIGGGEHPGQAAAPPGASGVECNLGFDVPAAQVVFDTQPLRIWQVPRDAYRQCLVSETELRRRVGRSGRLGGFLYGMVRSAYHRAPDVREPLPESYVLGDSPLVLLSALRSAFEPDPASSSWHARPTPRIAPDGSYLDAPGAREMRVYSRLDTRLMLDDLYLKLEEFSQWQDGPAPSEGRSTS